MPPFKKPVLPPGPHRELNDHLHQLHREAGHPSGSQIAKAWQRGKEVGKYRMPRATSSVIAMFTEKSLPDGLALWELVEVLMTDFPPVREARAVGAAQREARALLNDAHMPDPMSERVTLLHETGLRYFGLANLIREAEELSARHPFVERRLAAWLEARPLAAELLGEEHDLVKNLAGEIFIASIEVKTKKKFGGRAESDPETRDSKLSEQEEWLAEEAPLGW